MILDSLGRRLKDDIKALCATIEKEEEDESQYVLVCPLHQF